MMGSDVTSVRWGVDADATSVGLVLVMAESVTMREGPEEDMVVVVKLAGRVRDWEG